MRQEKINKCKILRKQNYKKDHFPYISPKIKKKKKEKETKLERKKYISFYFLR